MFSVAKGTSVEALEVEDGEHSTTLMAELVGLVPKILFSPL